MLVTLTFSLALGHSILTKLGPICKGSSKVAGDDGW